MNEHGRNDRDILRYTDVEYTPEGYEDVYRWDDFLEIAGGDARYAAMLINRTVAGEPEEGLHPETLVDQDIRDGEAFMLAGRPIVPEDVYDLPRTVHGLYSELVDNVGRSGTLLRDWRGFSAGADADDAGLDEPEDPACVVQVLRYEPVPAPGCAVDPLSAILSLPADERDDPRVAGEIESVLTRVLGGDHEGNR